jgi:hypothetical protein
VAITTHKEMLVIPVKKVVDKKKNNWKKEEEKHKGSVTPQKCEDHVLNYLIYY